MYKTSESTAKLDEALAKAQGEFTNPEKNRTVNVQTRTGGSYSFDYATFDSIVEMARPVLAKHGITVSQLPSTSIDAQGNTIVTVATRVAHAGEWMLSEISGPCEGHDMQKIGSGLTYLERYSYSAMLGIVSEYDDDGAAAGGHSSEPAERKPSNLPSCPKCGHNRHVIKGKEEFGGGYLCFAKKGGCGEKWQDGSAAPPKQEQKPSGPSAQDLANPYIDKFAGMTYDTSLMDYDKVVADLKAKMPTEVQLLVQPSALAAKTRIKEGPPKDDKAEIEKWTKLATSVPLEEAPALRQLIREQSPKIQALVLPLLDGHIRTLETSAA